MKRNLDMRWHSLDENKIPVPTSMFMAEEGMKNRHVMNHTIDGVHISTVFLPFDHGFYEDSPRWFETMIFGGKYDNFQYRYETWDEAQRGHIAISLPIIKERRTEKKIFKLVDRMLWLLMVTITLIGCVIWTMI